MSIGDGASQDRIDDAAKAIARLLPQNVPVAPAKPASQLRSFHILRMLRNKPCPCGSQIKYKRCCGLTGNWIAIK